MELQQSVIPRVVLPFEIWYMRVVKASVTVCLRMETVVTELVDALPGVRQCL